jgi:predicted ATPase
LLTHLALTGFKCFEDTGEIPLSPLTLIFGKNNSGKSTILQSLLLLKQTIETPQYGPRLNTKGALYSAGNFADLIYGHQTSRGSSFSFSLTLSSGSTITLEFAKDTELGIPRLSSLTVRSPEVERLSVKRSRGQGGPYELVIGDHHIGLEEEANFSLVRNRFFPLIGEEPPRVGAPNQKQTRSRKNAVESLNEVQHLLENMRAVGAFRKAPARRYEYEGRVPDGPDPAGESMAQVLIADDRRRGKKRGEIIRVVNKWLRDIGRVSIEIKTVAQDVRLYEIRTRDMRSRQWANLADVGFGVGQALPVLVEGVRTPKSSIYLVQEPEIHLHTDAQLAMADFLVDLSKKGRQVIVETHSEAMLLRVRRRIAEGRLKPNDVSFLVVEKGAHGPSRIRLLDADNLGQINGWPKDFLGDAAEERLELLGKMAAADSLK